MTIRRFSWVIETLTNGRKKKVQLKDSVERKLYGKDSVTIKATTSPNLPISMKL